MTESDHSPTTNVVDVASLSRTLSHLLRHEPWLYELELDDEGWVEVDAVVITLRALHPEWGNIAETDLAQMMAKTPKRRHEINNGRIRALYGHSLSGKLTRSPAVPPDVLYHGTARGTVSSIRKSGLLPMGRQYVHLSVDEATAAEVGRRKATEPMILRVLAGRAYANGVYFYEGNEKVWLADSVPAEFVNYGE